MLALSTVSKILTSTLATNISTTTDPSMFGENGLTLFIVAAILILILLMLLCCFCASYPNGGNCNRRYQTILPTTRTTTSNSVLPTQAPSVTQNRPIINPQNGQPILKTYKVSTHSTLSGESVHEIPSRSNLLHPSSSNYQQLYQQYQQQKKNINPFINSPLQQQQQRQQYQSLNTNPFYDVPLDTVSAPKDYYSRHDPRQYPSDF